MGCTDCRLLREQHATYLSDESPADIDCCLCSCDCWPCPVGGVHLSRPRADGFCPTSRTRLAVSDHAAPLQSQTGGDRRCSRDGPQAARLGSTTSARRCTGLPPHVICRSSTAGPHPEVRYMCCTYRDAQHSWPGWRCGLMSAWLQIPSLFWHAGEPCGQQRMPRTGAGTPSCTTSAW